ncbi:MAG: hypothetical protein ACJA09_000847 [Alcanivorax sp.]|jgi:uncharacterized protein YcgL (UPF0745 family)
MKIICQIFKGPRKPGSYLYVDKVQGVEAVPELLLKQFGELEEVMTLLLSPKQKLARVSVQDVMDGIREHGFFLQMPPGEKDHVWQRSADG